MKSNLKGVSGIKGLALRHGEKVAIAVFGGLALWFVVSSLKLPHLEDRYDATKLQSEVTQTNNAVTESTWPQPGTEEEKDVRIRKPIAKTANVAINPKDFSFSGLNPPVIAASLLRIDPEIVNAEDVRAYGGAGLLAFRDEDTLREQERRRTLEEEEKAAEELRRQEAAAEEANEGGEAPGGRRGGRAGRGGPEEGEFGAGEIDPDHPDRRLIENIASPAGVPLQGGERLERAYWATVVAKVPIREQLKKFQDAFQNARGGFDPSRDFPRYVGYEVQRSTVEPGKPLEWKRIPVFDGQRKSIPNKPVGNNVNDMVVRKLAELATTEWGGQALEPVDARWTDPMLTMLLPPLVGRDFGADATHPDIPLAINAPPLEEEALIPTEEPAEQPADPEDGFTAGNPGLMQPGSEFGGPGRSAYPGAGMPGRGSAAREFGGPREFGGASRFSGAEPGGEFAGPGRGGNFGGGIATGQRTDLPRGVDHLLLRFFDFTVEPGKKYKYRVRIVVGDPNYGILPTLGMLDQSVLDRQRKEIQAARAKKRDAPYYRVAEEFSEPSPTVGIPLGGLVYLAEAKLPSGKTHNDEPIVNLIAETFDSDPVDSVIHVAIDKEYRRGAVVNLNLKEKVLYTGENERFIDTKESYELNTGLTLLDMVGADKLVKETTAPARVLMMDVAGQLSVRDELNDGPDAQYLRLIFNEDKRRTGRPEDPGGAFGPEGGRGGPAPRRGRPGR